MTYAVLAWESHSWFLDDLGHGLGALLTSPAIAGIAVLLAALIAADQVRGTRADDRAATRRAELWERFEWIAENHSVLGAAATAEMFVLLETEAKKHDQNLAQLIGERRVRTLRQASQKRSGGGAR